MPQDIRTRLLQTYEQFTLEGEAVAKQELRDTVFSLLLQLPELSSNDYQLWGLTYYFSDQSAETAQLALEKFIKAYEADSNNFLACLYIAHCYQDQQELDKALQYYELVDKKGLRSFQFWRYVKLLEQIGYCHHQLGRVDVARQIFTEVVDLYQQHTQEDLAAPTELLACLAETDELVIAVKDVEDYLD